MTVGLTVLNTVLEDGFLDHVNEMGQYLLNQLSKLPVINCRGKGLLVGCDVSTNNAPDIAKKCMELGLLVNASSDETIRFIPALIVHKEDIDNAISILKEAIESVNS